MSQLAPLNQSEWDEDIDDDVPAIDSDDDENIVRPFDPAKIRVETKTMTIDLLLKRIQYDELDLAPDFQRQANLWKPRVKSRLIESLLIRIPIPAFYLDATDEDTWFVIDGLQRLSTLKSFILDNTLKLVDLEFLSEHEGKTYHELPRNLQRRIMETQVTVYLIEKGTPPDVKFNMFRRINTGGLPLSRQEIRHALNQGKSTSLLKELAESPAFLQATAHSIPKDRMEDREFILRFFAFKLTSPFEYKGQEFDSFLSNTMQDLNALSDESIDQLKQDFLKAMHAAHELFGNDAFRKRYQKKDKRKPLNKALFETWSVELSALDISEVEKLKERQSFLKDAFIELNNSRFFDTAISQGTSDPYKVYIRFSWIQMLIRHILSEEFQNKSLPLSVE
jgi:Protein of unknown function DUF262